MRETEEVTGPCPQRGCQKVACQLLLFGGAAFLRVGGEPRFCSMASSSIVGESNYIFSWVLLAPNDLWFFRGSRCIVALCMLPLAEILSSSFPTQQTPPHPWLTHQQKLLVPPCGCSGGPYHSMWKPNDTSVVSGIWPSHLPPKYTCCISKAGSCLIHIYVPRRVT